MPGETFRESEQHRLQLVNPIKQVGLLILMACLAGYFSQMFSIDTFFVISLVLHYTDSKNVCSTYYM